MSQQKSIRADTIVAFDVHVHVEHQGQDSAADQAARKYFGDSGAGRSPEALAITAPATWRALYLRWTRM